MAVIEKQSMMDAHDQVFRRVVRFLKAVFRLAREDELAERLLPAIRRINRGGSVFSGPLGAPALPAIKDGPEWSKGLTARPSLTSHETDSYDLYEGDELRGCSYVAQGRRHYEPGVTIAELELGPRAGARRPAPAPASGPPSQAHKGA